VAGFGQVGAQDVGQHQGVTGVGFLARDAVAIPVSVHCFRVDREHLPPGRAQAGDQQAATGLDRHRYRVVRAVSGIGKQLQQQQREPGGVVADAPLGQQHSFRIDQGHVVMVLGPVAAAEHSQVASFCGTVKLLVRSLRGARVCLMAGLNGPTSHQSFVTPAHRRALGLQWSSKAPLLVSGDPCRRLEPRT
jgi:hypothetical protein